MFDNVALNVVIGLIFIYLLYSLLATVISEIIATYIGLRARNLKEAVDVMLNDADDDVPFIKRLIDSLKLMKNPKNPRIDKFYSNPEIKYLGSTGIFKNPSSFKSETFSRTLLYELNGAGELNKDNIRREIMYSIDPVNNKPVENEEVTDDRIPTLDKQSAQFVLSLLNDSYGDLTKFRLQLEAWFDRTMDQCTEWYKRKIQVVLLILGFSLAWFFNADTFSIIHKLSTDKDARNNLVSMATAYIEAHPKVPDSAKLNLTEAERDSLYAVKKQLEDDIANANSILGTGGWPADSVLVSFDEKTRQFTYLPQIDADVAMKMKGDSLAVANGKYIHFVGDEKRTYFFNLVSLHFFGFLITAIAISLGAPFWFDLLNKLMKLRTSEKVDTDSTVAVASTTVSPLNRVG